MKKKNLKIIELIPTELLEGLSSKKSENIEVVEFILRRKRIKISKVKDRPLSVLTFEKNNIGGILFNYGILTKDSGNGLSIRLFQKSVFKDREVGFLKLRKTHNEEKD